MADLDAEQAYSTKVRGVNVILNLKDTDLEATRHSKERQFRHDEKISNRAIIQAVELAIGKIIQDYANGELGNDEPFHIRMVGRGKGPSPQRHRSFGYAKRSGHHKSNYGDA